MTLKKLVVSGLPESITEDNLYDLFDLYGCIEDVQLRFDGNTSLPLGMGMVTFRSEDCARDALEAVNGLEILGSRLMVRPVLDELAGSDDAEGDLEFVAEISRPLWDKSRKPAIS